jgi:hypothetical protein
MEPAGITPTTPLLQRSATVPAKRKSSGDGDVDIKRLAAAASIRPNWHRQELKHWDPIAEKPQIVHLKAAAIERAAAVGFDLKCAAWVAPNFVEWLEKTELPPGWSHSLTPTTPLGKSASGSGSSSGAKQQKKMSEIGKDRNSDDSTARTLDLNSIRATSSPVPLHDLSMATASRTAEAASQGNTQDGNTIEEAEEEEEEEEDGEDGNKPRKTVKKVRWGPAWYDASPPVSPHRHMLHACITHSL